MLLVVAFRFVETQYPGQDNSCGDDDWFEFGPGGVLAVHYADGNREHRYYSPQAWSELLTDQPPGPPAVDRRDWGFLNESSM